MATSDLLPEVPCRAQRFCSRHLSAQLLLTSSIHHLHHIHLFHRHHSLRINCSIHPPPLSSVLVLVHSRDQTEPSIHRPDMTVLCQNAKMRKGGTGRALGRAVGATLKSRGVLEVNMEDRGQGKWHQHGTYFLCIA